MTFKTNKTKFIIGIAAAVVLSTLMITSSTLTTAIAQTTAPTAPTVPTSQCPPGDQVQHWDKIVFQINSFRNGDNDGKQQTIGSIPASYMGTDLDLKIADQPGVVANLKQEIVNSIASQFTLTTQQQTTLYNDIRITSDNYETVNCGMTGPQGPAGPQGAASTVPGPAGPQGVAGPQGPAGSGSSGGGSGDEQSPPITKFLKVKGQLQGDITGSVTEKGKEGTIGVVAVEHQIISPRDPASGLPTGKRVHSPLVVITHIDKSTTKLYEALVTNENLPTVELDYYKTNSLGEQVLYFTIQLTNANISSIAQTNLNSQDDPNMDMYGEYEEVSFTYQKITWTWTDGGITAQDDWQAGP